MDLPGYLENIEHELKTVTLNSNKIDDVLIKKIKFGPISISFSHDVYLLFYKISERIDEPISRKANNSVISNVLIKKTEMFWMTEIFSY